MISDIDFSGIKDSDNFKYATKLDYFKNNTALQFKPGLNIIFAPNGTGKSTLLKIMAQFTASEQGGVSTVTDTWLRDVSSGTKLKGLNVTHDGQAVMYKNPRDAVGLIGGMAGFDDDFFLEGVREAQLKESTGMTTITRMAKILNILTAQTPFPEKIEHKSPLNKAGKDILNGSIPKGQKTLLLDEPESGLAIHVQAKLWKLIEKASIEQDMQIIVATHSPFSLTCKANYIELQPGYLNTSKEYIKDIAYQLGIMEEILEITKTKKPKK